MLKRRIHFFEIEDLSFCPRVIRDSITDILQHSINMGKIYFPVAPLLLDALAKAKSNKTVDLCSGGGGPWPSLLPELNTGPRTVITVLLTDKFPNARAFDRTKQLLGRNLNCQSNSISAFDVPAEIQGFFEQFLQASITSDRRMVAK